MKKVLYSFKLNKKIRHAYISNETIIIYWQNKGRSITATIAKKNTNAK